MDYNNASLDRLVIRALPLFNFGCKAYTVAKKLQISLKRARQIYRIFLQTKSITDQCYESQEVTAFYGKELEQKRKQFVSGFLSRIANKKLRGFKGLNDPEIAKRIKLILFGIPNAEQIILFSDDGVNAVEWTP